MVFGACRYPKMRCILSEVNQKVYLRAQSPLSSLPSNSNYQKEVTSSSSSGSKISPALLFVIIILAVVFFISGVLHLFVKFLVKHRSSSSISQSNRYPEMSESSTFQRQLQQLFNLHDSGLDQAFIDALPVFLYEELMGLKEQFDCAVCLCEFAQKDKLRLLPLCGHAFHIDCIDTWLLSNSTCPLCRGNLFMPGYPIENTIFDFEESGDVVGFSENLEGGASLTPKSAEHDIGKRVFSVRLGKFRNMNNVIGGEAGDRGDVETSSSNLEARRCYSMGSYQYVVADSELQVSLASNKISDTACPGDLRIVKGENEQNGKPSTSIIGDFEGKMISSRSKGESFSISKTWLWSKKAQFPSSVDPHIATSSGDVSLMWKMDRIQATK